MTERNEKLTEQRIEELLWNKTEFKPTTQFLTQLRSANQDRQKLWDPGNIATPLFRATELGGEVGEALNEVKKLEREKMGFRGSRTTVEKLADELADIIICADLVAAEYGIDLEEAVRRKFNETSDKVGFDIKL